MRHALRLLLLLMLAAALFGCGRKAPPRWVEPVQLDPPNTLLAARRPEGVKLAWLHKKPEGVAFEVHRAGPDGAFLRIGRSDTLQYLDRSASPDVPYTYRVTAFAERSLPAYAEVFVEAGRGLALPVLESFRIDKGRVQLRWEYGQGAVPAGYYVYKSTSSGKARINVSPVTEMLISVEAEPSVEVAYTVRAVLVRSGSETEGPESAALVVRPSDFVPAPPTGLDVTVLPNAVLITWDQNPEGWVRSYRIYRAEGGGDYARVGESRTLAFTDQNPPAGQLRYGVTAAGPSTESDPAKASPVSVR